MVDDGERAIHNLVGSRNTRRPIRGNSVHDKDRTPQSHEQPRRFKKSATVEAGHTPLRHNRACPRVINTPADVFSRLVEKDATTEVNHPMTLTCSSSQQKMVRRHHEWLCTHNGVSRTLALMTQRHPDKKSETLWPQLRHDVPEYIVSCATYEKMEVRHKSIRASHFVLSILQPM